ncbi:Dabb family protein [Elizabethkingia miricola]|uniref:Dabb family protein n=1 Tax=Elizabethkingia miricola TaxID=172045 RepID=UPI002ACE1E66|nr:Dabb family protein [Elizabethkingia miricola]WQM39437.1 Dabb family protein [Elizabethkingia miricola]
MNFIKAKNIGSIILSSGFAFLLIRSFITYNGRSDNPKQESRIEHLVLFRFKNTITLQEKEDIINRFMALKNSLKDGKHYMKIEYGFQKSRGVKKGNYDVGFRVTFNSMEDRDYYVGKIEGQPVPVRYDHMHDAFKNFVSPYLDIDDLETKGILVFDYVSNEKGDRSVPDNGYRLHQWTLFKLKAGVSQTQKQEIINFFLALKNNIKNKMSYIEHIEYGEQNSKEGLNRGFELIFRVSFNSKIDRDYYNSHSFLSQIGILDPNYIKYKDCIFPFLDEVLVYDYEVKR